MIKVSKSIQDSNWGQIKKEEESIFLSTCFFNLLEESKSIGEETGWVPLLFSKEKSSCLFTFIKGHSYGEYIFDWDWANFYHSYNVPYYPKLTSMIPFTSVTTSHFKGMESQCLMNEYEQFYLKNNLSSSHFLFIKKEEIAFFETNNYLIRDSFQYHFYNKNYVSFNEYITDLKSKKAKQILKERDSLKGIQINKITGEKLTLEHAQEMYGFYLKTIESKNAIAYLSRDFFIGAFDNLKMNLLYVQAKSESEVLAGALYFYDKNRLYGRYWGADKSIPNLHFELCLYQGIEFCIEKKIDVFEAGAQGEHKISRGFRPTKTYSAHKFKHPQFHNAIAKYIEDERESIDLLISNFSKKLPFKDPFSS